MKQALAHCLAALLVCWRFAFSLNASLDMNQYGHTAWKISDGFAKGIISSIAQTPDGYLWLGTEFGLSRFDGVNNASWEPPTGQQLPSNNILKLLTGRDGTLWIGTAKGLASWRDGKLTRYEDLDNQRITKILEDRQGSVWVGAIRPSIGRLCAIQKGRAQCYGADGRFGRAVLALCEYRGDLWVGTLNGLWHWKPPGATLYPMPDQIDDLIEGDNGALWIAMRGGIRQLVDGKAQAHPLSIRGQVNPYRTLRDRDGGLWIGTSGQGLLHWHQGRTDVFASADGLTGDSIQGLFDDKEGNIWVATSDGIDRFRDLAASTISLKQGLSAAIVGSILAAKDGSIWIGTMDGLDRWNNGQITVYRKRSSRLLTRAPQPQTVSEINDEGLPDNSIESLFQDDRGRIWVATARGLAYFENGHFIPVPAARATLVHSIAQESSGNLWIDDQDLGLVRLQDGQLMEQIGWGKLSSKGVASALAGDPMRGGLWLGFLQGGLAYFKDGKIQASYSGGAGLGGGRVNRIRFDGEGALWAATEGGLSRLKDGRIATLTSKNGLPCDAVQWSMEDDSRSVWLNMACGLVSIARPELEAWISDPNHKVRATVFDNSDGVRSLATAGGFSPRVTKSGDGKLWFQVPYGVSVIDPVHLPFNKLPPPVHIEEITADHKPRQVTPDLNGHLRLPPLVRDLQIDYTALSLVAPEKIRFRYKLEGHDTDWQEAGNRRQAFYNDLPPRKYRFRVIACNNSGVWNESGASFDFFIEPAYYQTTWFLVSCAAVFLAMLAGLYRLRLWYLVHQFNMRLDERVGERTRIARDLHDTMLQSFQGVLLKFHAVTYALPDRPAEARKTLESAIEEARQAIAEGRDAVQGLRSSTVPTEDLARAIGTLGEGLAASPDGRPSPDFRVQVEGTTRKLAPVVRDEVYRIAGEAMRNAFRHAGAGRVEVDIHYDKRQLIVRIRDNGKGIDAKVLDEGGRAGHHGLPGMHERAKLVGGKLGIWSELHSGTEIELTVPAPVAYAKPPAASRPPSSGKETG